MKMKMMWTSPYVCVTIVLTATIAIGGDVVHGIRHSKPLTNDVTGEAAIAPLEPKYSIFDEIECK